MINQKQAIKLCGLMERPADESQLDIVMMPNQHTCWMNVYKSPPSAEYYNSRDKARVNRNYALNYIKTTKVEWEE